MRLTYRDIQTSSRPPVSWLFPRTTRWCFRLQGWPGWPPKLWQIPGFFRRLRSTYWLNHTMNHDHESLWFMAMICERPWFHDSPTMMKHGIRVVKFWNTPFWPVHVASMSQITSRIGSEVPTFHGQKLIILCFAGSKKTCWPVKTDESKNNSYHIYIYYIAISKNNSY